MGGILSELLTSVNVSRKPTQTFVARWTLTVARALTYPHRVCYDLIGRRINKMKKGTSQKDKLHALRRIEGQIRGIHRMIEEGRYCIDILRALGAAVGALKAVEAEILKTHLNGCVKAAFKGPSGKEKESKLDEIYQLFKGFSR